MKADIKTIVTVNATMELTEQELGALDALAGYGDEAFLATFYEKMGRAYLTPYEQGLRGLFKKIREVAPPALRQARDMRKALRESKP